VTYIVDADEWRHVMPADGFSELLLELDPGGRIRLTGNEVPGPGERYPMWCATYSPDAIDILADRLRAMAAHSRGEL